MKELLFISTFAISGLATIQAQSPNIILIITDQQNSSAMSCTGNPYLSTPNIDSLASNGLLFKNAYCTSPVSGPSRSSIVTGKMPSQIGMDWNDNSCFKEGVITMGDVFSKAGYRSVLAGKWHLPEIYPQRTMNKKIESYGFEFLPFYSAPASQWLMGSYTDPPLTKAVVNFLEEYNEAQPLFLSINYHNPHDICFVPRKDGYETKTDTVLLVRPFGMYRMPNNLGLHPDSIRGLLPPIPDNFYIDSLEPEFVNDKRIKSNPYGDEVQYTSEYTEKEWQSYIYNYYRLNETVDKEVGIIVDALKRKNLYQNSIIIFTSDHGDGMGAHKWAAKLSFYEESVKVPFILIAPGQKKGVCDNLVSLLDIFPTCLDYADIHLEEVLPGISLKRKIDRTFIVTELADNPVEKNRKGRMVRSTRFKYCIYSSGKRNEQLFDITLDPGEKNNLAYSSEYREVLNQHRLYLKDWQKKVNDKFKVIIE
ncbi:MAG: sulfatase family protein [Bacteroidales bacterium]